MSPEISNWLNLLFRWLHVIAGVMWIGHLWFFNFVNGQVAKTYDAESKKKVIPELMPRALYWFRWGAAWTFITGFFLLGIVYYMGGSLVSSEDPKLSVGMGSALSLGALVIGFVIYDALWKAMAKQEMAGMVVSLILITAVAFGLSQVFVARAVFIHIGAIFGTSMAANVWMRIWPNQRKIIAGAKNGTPVDPALGAMAGLRSKHNTYMSMPLIFFMVSNHYPTVYGQDQSWIYVPVFVALGWLLTKRFYSIAASPAPAQYLPESEAPASAAANK